SPGCLGVPSRTIRMAIPYSRTAGDRNTRGARRTFLRLLCFLCSGPLQQTRILPGMSPTRRDVLKTAALGSLAIAAGVDDVFGQARPAPPNIVYMMADDLGYADVSCYGRPDFQTPNVDRIAARGVRFLQGYANSAVCSATRTALITGRYQYRLRLGLEEPLGGNNRDVGLPPEHPTLPSLLKAQGYGTTLVGKWHLGFLPNFSPLKSGYDHFYGFPTRAIDYYRHTPGGPNEDFWDDDMPLHQVGYPTTLFGDRAVGVIDAYA